MLREENSYRTLDAGWGLNERVAQVVTVAVQSTEYLDVNTTRPCTHTPLLHLGSHNGQKSASESVTRQWTRADQSRIEQTRARHAHAHTCTGWLIVGGLYATTYLLQVVVLCR